MSKLVVAELSTAPRYQQSLQRLFLHIFNLRSLLSALLGSILVGIGLWIYSDFPPPYGEPSEELTPVAAR